MDYLENDIHGLVLSGFLPANQADEAYKVARRFTKTKGLEQVKDKLNDLGMLKRYPRNPLAYITSALNSLPDYSLIAEIRDARKRFWALDEQSNQRLIEIARTKWIDEDD